MTSAGSPDEAAVEIVGCGLGSLACLCVTRFSGPSGGAEVPAAACTTEDDADACLPDAECEPDDSPDAEIGEAGAATDAAAAAIAAARPPPPDAGGGARTGDAGAGAIGMEAVVAAAGGGAAGASDLLKVAGDGAARGGGVGVAAGAGDGAPAADGELLAPAMMGANAAKGLPALGGASAGANGAAKAVPFEALGGGFGATPWLGAETSRAALSIDPAGSGSDPSRASVASGAAVWGILLAAAVSLIACPTGTVEPDLGLKGAALGKSELKGSGDGALALASAPAGLTTRPSAGLNSKTRWFWLSCRVMSSILPNFPFAFTNVSPGQISLSGLCAFHVEATEPIEIFSMTLTFLFSSS